MISKLENYLAKELYTRFGQYSIRQNYRPDWLEGLELDFYIDELNLAAEVQGDQHYQFVEWFHRTKENFQKQLDRDAKKSLICRQRGIKLFEIFTEKDADLFITTIKEKNKPKEKYFYQEPSPNYRTYKKLLMQKGNKKIKKLESTNSPEERKKRIEKCKRKLELAKCGKIKATEHDFIVWEKIIQNDGVSL